MVDEANFSLKYLQSSIQVAILKSGENGFIMLDNSQLTPGMYYYNIVANGQVSSTQKLVLVK